MATCVAGAIEGLDITDCDGTACGSDVCLQEGVCTSDSDSFNCSCSQVVVAALC